MKKYIRVGDIPLNEESRIHKGDVIFGYEKGVSVYNTILIDDKWRIIMPLPFKEGQGNTYESLIQEVTECRFKINNPRRVYLVEGDEIGIGSDNEPLLKNVRIIEDITEQFK